MKSFSFVGPNISVLPRSPRIADEIWERYKVDILREFPSKGAHGYAYALKWIKGQAIPGFNPNAKQLRHRITGIWKERISPPTDTQHASASAIFDEIDTFDSFGAEKERRKGKHTDIIGGSLQESSCSTPIFPDLDEGKGSEIQSSNPPSASAVLDEVIPSSLILLALPPLTAGAKRRPENEESNAQGPRKRHNEDNRSKITATNLEICDIELDAEITTSKPECRQCENEATTTTSSQGDIHLKDRLIALEPELNYWDLYSPRYSPTNNHLSPTQRNRGVGLGVPRRPASLSPTSKPSSCVQHSSGSSIYNPRNPPILFSTSRSSSPMQPDGGYSPSSSPTSGSFSPTQRSMNGQENVKDPVIDPRRLQTVLEKIGIEWHLEYVTRCLRRDIVLRTSTPPIGGSLPEEACSMGHIIRVRAFAELLFASSIVDEAFPLFLHIWIIRRGDIGPRSIKALIQCARSAVRKDDKDLVRILLEQGMSLGDRNLPDSGLIHSLKCLEISHLLQQQGYKGSSKTFRLSALRTCPTQFSLLDTIDNTRRWLHDRVGRDLLSGDIVKNAFLTAEHCEALGYGRTEKFEEYSLRDVLLVGLYLENQEPSVARSGVRYIRFCLNRALEIFQRPGWSAGYKSLQLNISKTKQKGRRDGELAVYLDLLANWWDGIYPSDNLEIEETNPIPGMSILEVLSAITFFVVTGHDILNYLYIPFDMDGNNHHYFAQDVSERTQALLNLQDDRLLLGFLWFSLKISRKTEFDKTDRTSLLDSYRDMVTKIFVDKFPVQKVVLNPPKRKGYKMHVSMMTDISTNPTMASSLTASSTLSSMRRQSRMMYASFISGWSSRAMSVDELSECASHMTVSDGGFSRPVSGSEVSGLDKGSSSAPEDVQVVPHPKPPVPAFPNPEIGNRRISLPLKVVLSTNLLVPKDNILKPCIGEVEWI